MITIVGAGLVGSLWAVLLRKKGFEVTVFERRSDPRSQKNLGGRSINLVVTSRGMHGLEKAGLSDKINSLAVAVYGRMIHSKTGDLVYQPYGKKEECNLSVSRAELNRFLIDEAERAGAKIYFEHELQDLNTQKREAVFKTSDGTKSVTYEVLFGADGAGSRVRKLIAKLYPNEIQEHTDWLEADYKELTMPLQNGKAPLRTDALHIWPRGAHMMMALANHDGSFTMTAYLPKIKSGNLHWAFSQLQSKEDIKALFQNEFPDAIPLMPSYLSEFAEHPQGTLGTVRCSHWTCADSIALIGDAAHAIVPFFGQGMNCGFEDCTTLLSLLEKYGKAWPKILQDYERTQKPNADAIADMALENWVEMRDKVGDARFMLRKKVESALEQKYPDVFKSRYGLITYTLVPYALAQKAGLKQGEIIDQILDGVPSFEQISWDKADELIQQKWLPFIEKNHLRVRA